MYLTNVEGVCRRFCDEKRARLVWAKDEALKFRDVWRQLSSEDQRRLLSEKAEVILKVRNNLAARAPCKRSLQPSWGNFRGTLKG